MVSKQSDFVEIQSTCVESNARMEIQTKWRRFSYFHKEDEGNVWGRSQKGLLGRAFAFGKWMKKVASLSRKLYKGQKKINGN